MDIERLKELKEAVFEDYRGYEVKNLKDEDGKVYPSTVPLDECYPIGKELLVLIDEAIARQSVASDEVQRAIELLREPSKRMDYFWLDAQMHDALNLAITALQAYQPAISKTETTTPITLTDKVKKMAQCAIDSGVIDAVDIVSAIIRKLEENE